MTTRNDRFGGRLLWGPSGMLLASAALIPVLAFVRPGPTQRGPSAGRAEAERALRDYWVARRNKEWPRAIECGQTLTRLAPQEINYQYNLACVYSLNADVDDATVWLSRAATNGFSLLRLFETDPDLDNVRSHEGYKTALSLVRENRGKELADLRARFEKTPLLVLLPPDHRKDQAAPLIVALHGKGGRATGGAAPWRDVAADMGAILIAPQAVLPLGGGFSWNKADTNDSLGDNAEFLLRLTMEFARKNYLIDEQRTVLAGFSEGGGVCRWVGPRTPYMFAGVIPMGCDYIPEYDKPPKASGSRPPRFYFMAGERDKAAPAEQLHLAVADFKAVGYVAKCRIYPGVGHAFPIDRNEELRRAINFVLER